MPTSAVPFALPHAERMKGDFMQESTCAIKKASYPGLDILRFICSLLVVAIHVTPLTDVNQYLDYGITRYLARIAVPFFFVCSGFFLFRKTDRDHFSFKPIITYCMKIARLYGTWMILLLVGSQAHLWYLPSLVIAVLVVSFLIKWKIPIIWIFVIAALYYCVGLLGFSYYDIVCGIGLPAVLQRVMTKLSSFCSSRGSGMFMAVFYVTVGMLLAYKPIHMKTSTAVLGFCFSLLLMLVEAVYQQFFGAGKDSNMYNMYLFLVPTVFFLFSLAKGITLPGHPAFYFFRMASMLIYFSHFFFLYFVDKGLKFLLHHGFPVWIDHSLVRYLGTVCLSVCFSILVYRRIKKEQDSWVKYLYS